MSTITREKLAQAVDLVKDSEFDLWMTFARETAEGGDPVLPLILEGGLTWQSVLIVTRTGKKIAVLGNYDADPLVASGDWDEVVPYVQGIKAPLLDVLSREVKSATPRIAVNFSRNDDKADGLTHGMYLLLQDMFRGTRFENCLFSAEAIVSRLRSRKTRTEVERMRAAIRETERIFSKVPEIARVGVSERAVYNEIQSWIDKAGHGYSWDRSGDPIVNSGPDSMIGHGIPSAAITIQPGHIFHIDLGIVMEQYSSDLQRSWFVGETTPGDVARAFEAVHDAISAGAEALKPGAPGWEVDKAARTLLVSQGYEEYLHALGHQVGRVAHDGGGILGPRWDRYGATPDIPVEEDQVYTLELGVVIPDRGYLGIEEMVRVTSSGIEWLSDRQSEIWLLV